MTVLAVADGRISRGRRARKTAGQSVRARPGPVRQARSGRSPSNAGRFWPTSTQPGTQFPGWPQSFDIEANYGRKAAAFLPRLEIQGAGDPVMEVIDERSGECVYCLRLRGNSWQPHAFAAGQYTVRISVPEEGKTKELKGLEAAMDNTTKLDVVV